MNYTVSDQTITIPDAVLKDYKDTMKMDLNQDQVLLYAHISKQRAPQAQTDREYSENIIEELYREISRYNTFPGRHYV